MADDNVQVNITADTSGLTAPLTAAASSVQSNFSNIKSAAASVESQFSSLKVTATGLTASFGQTSSSISAASSTMEKVGSSAKAAATGLEEVTKHAKNGHVGIAGLVVEARALADEFAGGRLHQAAGTAMRTLGLISNINPMYAAAAAGVAALAGAFGYLLYEGYEYQKLQTDIFKSAAFSGLDLTKEQVKSLSDEYMKLTQSSASSAGEVISTFTGMNNSTVDLIRVLSLQVNDFSAAVKVTVPEATKVLKEAFSDPEKEGQKLLNLLPGLTEAQRQSFRVAEQSGNVSKMRAALIQIVTDRLNLYRGNIVATSEAEAKFSEEVTRATAGIDGMAGAMVTTNTQLALTAARTKEASEQTEALVKKLKEAVDSEAQLASQADKFAQKFNPLPAKIATVSNELEVMKSRLQDLDPKTDKAEYDFLAQSFAKGREELAKLQEEASGGNIVQRTQTQVDQIKAAWVGSAKAELEAERAKWDAIANDTEIAENRRIEAKDKSLAITKSINEQERKFELDTLENNIIAAQRGSVAKIAAAQKYVDAMKAAYGADSNEYAIAQRKVIEAKNEAARMGESVIQRTQTQVDQIKAAWVGSAKAELEAERAKWDAIANDTEVAENQREEARRKGLAITKTINDQERKFELDTLENNIIAAQRGSVAKIAAAQKYVDAMKAAYGADSNEYAIAQRKVIEAKNEAARMGEAASKKELTQEKKDQIDAIEGEIENIKTLADLHQISWQVELTELQKLEARKAAIAGEGAKSMAAITREVTRQMARDYQEAYKQIADRGASTITSLIFGHETLRQAAQKLLEEEVGSFIKGMFEKVAANLAGQQAMTAASTAGAGASMAVTGASILKSIAASASETFAGIFGFLSPVMGPAAAAPAAAGQATVMAAASSVPSFAVGAWGLPSDMIAQVHQGEMIVPAFQSGQFRNAIAALQGGGASQGGGGGGDIHHHWNFAGPVLDKNGLVKMITKHLDLNPSIRSKY